MANYQEILTKAVVGKGKLTSETEHLLECNLKPTKVLGCWVINHNLKPILKEDKVYVEGDYEVHIWYAYDEDKHGHLTREELMQEFHASSATVNLMLSYDQKDMSGISAIEFEECNTLSFASEDDGFFEIELRSVLDRVLDDDERMVFELVVNEGMKYKDVATKMGLTERKIKYLFDLCRKKLRPIYSENYEQYEKGKKKKK